VWTNTYDAAGRPLTAANPLGHTMTSEYDKVGNRTRTIDAAGNATAMNYDARNRLLTTTDPLGGVRTLTYDAEGRMLTLTDASGQRTTHTYDARGRMITSTDGAGNVIRTEYGTPANGLDGLAAAIVYPTFREEYRYDNRNRRTQVIRVLPAENGQPERRETSTTSYDGQGNAIAQIDALGRTTQTAFDRLNREIEATDAIGGKTSYTYDPRNNVLRVTDANGNTHRFTFDKRNRVQTEIRPMGQTTHYVYDRMGNLTERRDAKNQRQVHSYDAGNRRTKTETFTANSAVPAKVIAYSYDQRGLMTGYADGTTSATYTLDANGRRTEEAVDFGSFTKTIAMSYLPNGQLDQMRYADGAIIRYRYDAAGRPIEVEHPGGRIRYVAYRWQRPTRTELPGGLIRQEVFDALQRTTRIEVGSQATPRSVVDLQYTYNAVGNVVETWSGADSTTYDYDVVDRLISATPPADSGLPNEGYTYDGVGNRRTSRHQPGPWTYNANNELTIWGAGGDETALEYDANGNLIREQRGATTRTYRYDELDRLIEVADDGQLLARYAYDPFARRVRKETLTGTPRITWALNVDRGLIAEFDAAGTLTRDWVWEAAGLWSTAPLAQRKR